MSKPKAKECRCRCDYPRVEKCKAYECIKPKNTSIGSRHTKTVCKLKESESE